ncbi:hypothetical protein HELRODRAFT_67893, partial [Helobdella robusta]|uniref:FH2 domain-containing protein n=1 Tax=Helobdella robusta TaxID=6412 RepID=T1FZ72_HELRO
KKLEVLDQKRSNAINIGLVHLPKPNAIKTAIMNMDSSVLSREDIEKILTGMIPTEEEIQKITELRKANNDANSNRTAETFLETMGSISELQSRLKLWVFKLDYDALESEISDPLYDLKKGMDELKRSKTFKFILSTLLSVGNFLNNTSAPGFTIDYLTKVTEVKDTVYKHTLLHHLVNLIIDQFPVSGDLYTEISSIVRCSKIDWEDVKDKLDKLESDCKSSRNHLIAINKHDPTFLNKHKISDFLTSTMKRICIVKIVYKRVFNRWVKFLLWLGYTVDEAKNINVKQFCQTLSEFALEFRTMKEKVQNARIKKQNMKERKKTRGLMIVQVGHSVRWLIG